MRTIVVALLALVWTTAVIAGPSEDGEAAYQRKDYAAALRFWRPLAENGDYAAQIMLGLMYEHGQGVPVDDAQAAAWYRRAANQGRIVAQFVLGTMYENGRGVPQDYVLAHMWYNLAAANFSRRADEGHNSIAVKRDAIAAKLTPVQLAEAQRLAREWSPAR